MKHRRLRRSKKKTNPIVNELPKQLESIEEQNEEKLTNAMSPKTAGAQSIPDSRDGDQGKKPTSSQGKH